jgi:hypothetical protein
MATIVPNYLAHNEIGNLKEDFIQIPATNTETLVTVPARMNTVLFAQAVAVNNNDGTSDQADAHEATVIPSGRDITMTGVVALIEYRIHAMGV